MTGTLGSIFKSFAAAVVVVFVAVAVLSILSPEAISGDPHRSIPLYLVLTFVASAPAIVFAGCIGTLFGLRRVLTSVIALLALPSLGILILFGALVLRQDHSIGVLYAVASIGPVSALIASWIDTSRRKAIA
jgi:hypothetical protein